MIGYPLSSTGDTVTDDFLFGPANAASVFATIKSARSRKIECLMVGVLSNGHPKVGGNAIVTHRVGRLPDDEVPDVV